MTLTEITVSLDSFSRYLSFCLGDDVCEFTHGTLCGLVVVGCALVPFENGPRHAGMRTGKGGGILRHGERHAVRDVFEKVVVFDLVPRRRIEVRQLLEYALCDLSLWTTGLINALQVIVFAMREHLVLCQNHLLGNVWKEGNETNSSKSI